MELPVTRHPPPSIQSILSKGLFPAIILASAVLRLVNLGKQSLWFDETYTAYVARQAPERMIQFLVTDGVHPPLYYCFMAVWIRIFGDSEWILRLPSAVCGVLAVLILYLLVTRTAGKPEAVLAAALAGFSPFLTWYSQDARMYSMECAAAVLAAYGFWLFLEHSDWKCVLGLILSHAVLYGIHYFGFFLFLAEFLFLVLFWRRHLRRWIPFLAAQAVAFLPLIIWGYVLLHRINGTFGIGWIPKPVWADPFATMANFFSASGGVWNLQAITGLAAVAALLVLSLRVRHLKETVVFSVFWLFIPIVLAWIVSQTLPVYIDRYLILALPPAAILVAIGARSIRGGMRLALPGVLFLAMVPGIWNMNAPTEMYRKEDWRRASESIRDQFQPGDLLLLRVYQEAVPFGYYGLLDRDWRPLETNGALDLAEIGGDIRMCYLVYWFPAQSAHTFGTEVPETYAEGDPDVREWIEENLVPVREESAFNGVVVLIMEPRRR
jgi:mannosyltransferase